MPINPINASIKARRGNVLLPLELELPPIKGLFGGHRIRLTIRSGLTTFVGPNGAGKSLMLLTNW